MKKILLTLVLMVGVVLGLFAQKLTYQAVIRDNNQQLVTNTAMKATVTITFATGTPTTYVETVNATTNIHGLLTFEFGDGTLIGRDFEGATITTTVKSADESTVYVDNLMRPVSAVPYALSVNGQSIQNYLTEHNYVDKAELDSRHYLTSDSTVITTMQGSLLQLSNKLDVQIAKLDSIAHIVDSLSKLPHGGGEVYGQPCPGVAKVNDTEGNEYNTVKIGDQCWMKENLRINTITNGYIYTPTVSGYDVAIYGRLYNWTAVMQGAIASANNPSGVRGICPEGWHVPSEAEWQQLINYVKGNADFKCGGEDNAFANALSAATAWTNPEECCAGHNSATLNKTGFSAVPVGTYQGLSLDQFGNKALFASTSLWGEKLIPFDLSGIGGNTDITYLSTHYFSVRCLKDN